MDVEKCSVLNALDYKDHYSTAFISLIGALRLSGFTFASRILFDNSSIASTILGYSVKQK